jgi:hypothetical protein
LSHLFFTSPDLGFGVLNKASQLAILEGFLINAALHVCVFSSVAFFKGAQVLELFLVGDKLVLQLEQVGLCVNKRLLLLLKSKLAFLKQTVKLIDAC